MGARSLIWSVLVVCLTVQCAVVDVSLINCNGRKESTATFSLAVPTNSPIGLNEIRWHQLLNRVGACWQRYRLIVWHDDIDAVTGHAVTKV